jgi:NitT/TauT family transport system substrate-binding protein
MAQMSVAKLSMPHVSRRAALTVIAGTGTALASRGARAQDTSGRVIYPVAVPIYQTQFVADRIGFFKEAGLDCKLIQGGSGVKTREIIASSQGDIGIGDVTHPMQLSNHGRAGRVLMPVDTRSSAVMFILRKDLKDKGINTLEAFTEWKRPDGRKPIVSVSSLGGTNHVWASYYMETMGGRRQSDLDRDRQCRHHAGLPEVEAGRHSRKLLVAFERVAGAGLG